MRITLLFFLAACGGSSPATPMDLAQAQTADLAQAQSSDTWGNFAQGFFQTYCVSCHSPGGQGGAQDFRQYADVMAESANIRCGVTPANQPQSGCSQSLFPPGNFPIGTGPKPSDADRLRLVAWIDAGLPM